MSAEFSKVKYSDWMADSEGEGEDDAVAFS
jgi:hypothetical protein